MKENCPICDGKKIFEILNRDKMPVHQNYLAETYEIAINAKTDQLNLRFCETCGFIFNAAFDEKKLQYDSYYENSQDLSNLFKDYIEEEINFFAEKYELKDKLVVEVGCGKGFFLKKLVDKTGCNAIGFDPSYLENNKENEHLKFVKDFYNEKYSHIQADFIICRHVIEHIAQPVDLLRAINKAVNQSKEAIIFFETPSVEWILKNNVLYDFFYEHCSYFDEESMMKAMNLSGFKVIETLKSFGGQYMWTIAKKENGENQIDLSKIDELKELSATYGQCIELDIERMKVKVKDLRKVHKIALWGAGAKGSTFVNLVDQEKVLIEAIVDINPKKQGCFILGSGHKIIKPEDLRHSDIGCVIVMNKNYRDEIKAVLDSKNIRVQLLSGEDLI